MLIAWAKKATKIRGFRIKLNKQFSCKKTVFPKKTSNTSRVKGSLNSFRVLQPNRDVTFPHTTQNLVGLSGSNYLLVTTTRITKDLPRQKNAAHNRQGPLKHCVLGYFQKKHEVFLPNKHVVFF